MPSTPPSTALVCATPWRAAIALLAVAITSPVWAGAGQSEREPQRDQSQERYERYQRASAAAQRGAEGFDYSMQVVGHDAAPAAPGYGWRYFSDTSADRAVVISPQGDYYYSRGKGLHWVAAEQI